MSSDETSSDEESSLKDSGNEEEEFWDDDTTTQATNQQNAGFTKEDYELIYGKKGPGSKPVGEEPGLLRATVNLKTFGKAESLASKDARSILPRLRSIYLDATSFVSRVREHFPDFPCLANLRNGLWYFEIPPDGECRFRSSDGHSRSWRFHLPRANIECARLGIERSGLVIVDSTRSGKTFPDSFNRTIPLWCCVLNRAMGFKDAAIELPTWLPGTERYHVSNDLIESWAQEVRTFMDNTNTVIQSTIPLKPFWIANDLNAWGRRASNTQLEDLVVEMEKMKGKVVPIICVSASAVIDPMKHRERFSWSYVPGAADDEENWSLGLTPELFWSHYIQLINMCSTSEECSEVVKKLVCDSKSQNMNGQAEESRTSSSFNGDRKRESYLVVTDTLHVQWGDDDHSVIKESDRGVLDLTWLHGQDKAWSRKNPTAWTDRAFPQGFLKFDAYILQRDQGGGDHPFVISTRDGETGLTMALAILCVYYDNTLQLRPKNETTHVDKHLVKAREASLIAKAQAAESSCTVISRRLFKEVSEYVTHKSHLDHKVAAKTPDKE